MDELGVTLAACAHVPLSRAVNAFAAVRGGQASRRSAYIFHRYGIILR